MGLMGLMVVDVGRSIPANLRLFALVFLLSFFALVFYSLSSFCSRLFALVFALVFTLVFLLSSCRWYHLYLPPYRRPCDSMVDLVRTV